MANEESAHPTQRSPKCLAEFGSEGAWRDVSVTSANVFVVYEKLHGVRELVDGWQPRRRPERGAAADPVNQFLPRLLGYVQAHPLAVARRRGNEDSGCRIRSCFAHNEMCCEIAGGPFSAQRGSIGPDLKKQVAKGRSFGPGRVCHPIIVGWPPAVDSLDRNKPCPNSSGHDIVLDLLVRDVWINLLATRTQTSKRRGKMVGRSASGFADLPTCRLVDLPTWPNALRAVGVVDGRLDIDDAGFGDGGP